MICAGHPTGPTGQSSDPLNLSGRRLARRLLAVSIWLALSGCSSPGTTKEDAPPPQLSGSSSLPDRYRQNGMVTSNTYQVYILVHAASREKALAEGEESARKKAYDLIIAEPFIPVNVSDYGRERVRNLVNSESRVVQILQESQMTWSLVLQVHKIGLRKFFETIR